MRVSLCLIATAGSWPTDTTLHTIPVWVLIKQSDTSEPASVYSRSLAYPRGKFHTWNLNGVQQIRGKHWIIFQQQRSWTLIRWVEQYEIFFMSLYISFLCSCSSIAALGDSEMLLLLMWENSRGFCTLLTRCRWSNVARAAFWHFYWIACCFMCFMLWALPLFLVRSLKFSAAFVAKFISIFELFC